MSSAIDPADVPEGWSLEAEGGEACLHRRFEFADFAEAWSFMSRVADEAERQQHHPDWSNSWNVVDIRLRSHDAGAVTQRDLSMARAVNELLR